MHQGNTVFAQLMEFVPYHQFQQCVKHYQGNKWVRTFTCWGQFLAMCFAQLTFRRSLRDIEIALSVHRQKIYHMGFRSPVKRPTLAKANEKRDYRIYRDFAYHLIDIARALYAEAKTEIPWDEAVYALDSTVVDLCLSLFPWAKFRSTKSAIKMHTLLDLKSAIPVFVDVTPGKVHDVNILDSIELVPGAIIVMDRAYLDFERLYRLNQSAVFFVIRAKDNLDCRRVYSQPVDKSQGVVCDQKVALAGYDVHKSYPTLLRRVRYQDENGKTLVFLTNNFHLPAKTIALLYKYRWQIELFFKWIKQHLRIKTFFGISENAVKTQIWIAISTYVLVAIVKKRLHLDHSLYTILQILSLSLFDKVPILQLLTENEYENSELINPNQLLLFN